MAVGRSGWGRSHTFRARNLAFCRLTRRVVHYSLTRSGAQDAKQTGGRSWRIPTQVVPIKRYICMVWRSLTAPNATCSSFMGASRFTRPAMTTSFVRSSMADTSFPAWWTLMRIWRRASSPFANQAARGVAFVPTLTILPFIAPMASDSGMTPARLADLRSAVQRHPEMARRAAEAGVLVLAGTDAGMGPHGMVREEIRRLLEAGLPPESALAAGSCIARLILGLSVLEEGAPADIVAYSDDPRGSLEVLARPTLRILDGHMRAAAR